MAAETIVLDPSEVASSRTEVDISNFIAEEGVDWGNAEIEAFMSEQARGEVPVDFRVPNRTITIPLRLKAVGATSFSTIRAQVQAKAALLQREGGWLKRVLSDGTTTVFCDIVNATLHLPGGWMQAHRDTEPDATLTLEALPDFYQAEVTLSDHSTTTAAELIFTEADIRGNYPGRVRVVVDEDDGDDQLSLLWAFRSRHYSAASTAATEYEAEELTALDAATKPALTGASGGTVVRHADLSTDWTPVVGTNLGGTSYLTHTGTYRCFGRVYSTSGTTVQTRFVWDVGDLVQPVENPSTRLPGADNFYIIDYGELRLDQVPVGTHRWQGQIQAKGDSGGEDFRVDKLWFLNTDEGMGILKASEATGFTSYAARDEFNQSAGALTGKVLPTGGTWTVVASSDADDFSVVAGSSHNAQRTAVSDASGAAGRMVTAGTATYATVDAHLGYIDVSADPGLGNENVTRQGVAVRVTDISNYLIAYLQFYDTSGSGALKFIVTKRAAGVETELARSYGSFFPGTAPWGIDLAVTATGVWTATITTASGFSETLTGLDSALATGGTLATGKVGIYDAWPSATASTRTYDNFRVVSPTPSAVLYANQSAELRWDGMFREDSTGTAYGPVSQVLGDLPRLPPEGLESRTTEVFLKASRGDLGDVPDSAIDDLSARVYYRPCFLYLPD